MTRELTRNQTLVYEELARSDGPLSAYAILENLRDQGLRAPPQVYRALEKLVDTGRVHRLESLNAFVACRHPESCDTHTSVAFAICDECGRVEELTSPALADKVATIAASVDFHVVRSTIELRGTCRDHH